MMPLKGKKSKEAFTLIELLVVVAIIAIIAVIAIPNLLEAQTRARVSRAKSEARTIATALAAYWVDNNNPPKANPDLGMTRLARLRPLSTPIAYISSVPEDVFTPQVWLENRHYALWGPDYIEALKREGKVILPPEFYRLHNVYVLVSRGPDCDYELDPRENKQFDWQVVVYDPTNGTVSNGDLLIILQ